MRDASFELRSAIDVANLVALLAVEADNAGKGSRLSHDKLMRHLVNMMAALTRWRCCLHSRRIIAPDATWTKAHGALFAINDEWSPRTGYQAASAIHPL